MQLNEEGGADVPREEMNVIATVLADGVDGGCGDGGDGEGGGGGQAHSVPVTRLQ